MKSYLTVSVLILLLSSCLKQSIPDAILNPSNGGQPKTATMSYEDNGNPVSISISIADDRDGDYYTLGCTKYQGYYGFEGVSDNGELNFSFITDTLTVGHYGFAGIYADLFVASYNNTNEFLHVPTDSITFNITSAKNGFISGNFSGRLTPVASAGYPNNTYGSSSSISITKGVFQNVPIVY